MNEDVDSDDGITELSSDGGDEGDESIEEGGNEGDESDSDKLFSGSRIKRADHAGLLMAFAICHNILQDAISDLISIIGLHLPVNNDAITSISSLQDFFTEIKNENSLQHEYCSPCFAEWDTEVICCRYERV